MRAQIIGVVITAAQDVSAEDDTAFDFAAEARAAGIAVPLRERRYTLEESVAAGAIPLQSVNGICFREPSGMRRP